MLDIPESIKQIFKLNPMYYIVTGYRDAFIYGDWFFEKPMWTLYYWSVVLVIGVIGFFTFKKLEKHGLKRSEVIFFGDDYGIGGNDRQVYESEIEFVGIDNYKDFPRIAQEILL